MRLVLARGGGVAGLRKPPLEVDTATLAAGARDRLCRLVEAADLRALPRSLGSDAPDQLGYTLTVTADDGHTDTIDLALDASPPPLRALISEIRRLAGARPQP